MVVNASLLVPTSLSSLSMQPLPEHRTSTAYSFFDFSLLPLDPALLQTPVVSLRIFSTPTNVV
jgi:hypothetical protein